MGLASMSFNCGGGVAIIFYFSISERSKGWDESWRSFFRVMHEWGCEDLPFPLQLEEECTLQLRTFDGSVLFRIFDEENTQMASLTFSLEQCDDALVDLALEYAEDPDRLKDLLEKDKKEIEYVRRLQRLADSSSSDDDADSVS